MINVPTKLTSTPFPYKSINDMSSHPPVRYDWLKTSCIGLKKEELSFMVNVNKQQQICTKDICFILVKTHDYVVVLILYHEKLMITLASPPCLD